MDKVEQSFICYILAENATHLLVQIILKTNSGYITFFKLKTTKFTFDHFLNSTFHLFYHFLTEVNIKIFTLIQFFIKN